MKKLLLTCVALLALAPATSPAVQTVYSYTGALYAPIINDPNPPAGSFTTDMRVQGSITLDEALAPNGDFRLSIGDLSSLSFSNGRLAFTQDNIVASPTIELMTGASGEIVDWNIGLQRLDPAPGIRQALLVTQGPCCDATSITESTFGRFDGATTSAGGTWTVTAIPEPSTYALMLVGIALVGFAVQRRMGTLAVDSLCGRPERDI